MWTGWRTLPAPARGRAIVLAGSVATVVVACTGGVPASPSALPTLPPIVDGWSTSEPVSCAEVEARSTMPAGRCGMLEQRALGYATEQWGPPRRWWMVRTLAVDDEGTPVLIASGAGVPDAIIVVEAGGAFHAARMGCFQPKPAGFPTDATCP